MQWKVRRTLAFSLHQLAIILGETVTQNELLPIYDDLLHDVDEVRTALVQNLSSFLRILPAELRGEFLPKLSELVNIDNIRNWRYRQDVAVQLQSLFDLFSMSEIHEFIVPLVLHHLASDQVAQVRRSAVEVLSSLFWRLLVADERQRLAELMAEFVRRFAQNNRWLYRQLFVVLCNSILHRAGAVSDRNVPSASVMTMLNLLMPRLIAAHTDVVPNVRIAVAKCFASHFVRSSQFTDEELGEHQAGIQLVIAALLSDRDRDVRYLIDRALNACGGAVDDTDVDVYLLLR
jgi:serine/threonine-protein phosphatase 4 regulatory subunit 1